MRFSPNPNPQILQNSHSRHPNSISKSGETSDLQREFRLRTPAFMSVPAIALYATPPGGVCSPDYDLNPSPSVIAHKSVIGGLSRLCVPPQALCSSNSVAFPAGDEVGSDLGSSHLYSSLKCRDQSPMSVFQGPMSGSRSSSSTPLARIPCEFGDFRAGRDRLFSGFVRNALGSCLDYDTPSLPVQGDFETDPEEFAFDMGYGHGEGDCEPYAKEMLCDAQSRHGIFREEFVVKAFCEAEVAHRGQMRASGDPYLKHCVETAIMLAEVGANEAVVAAGLLHDTMDDSFMNYDYIVRTFGPGVAELVGGVSKLSHLSKLARDNDTASRTVEADRMHTMFLAMADARAVLIKLADRLHNMMTLDVLPVTKQQRFAKETLEIFAPLANRLGIFSWKERLEDLCFKHLYPDQYNDLASKLVKTVDEAMIASAKEKLEDALDAAGISYCALFGRHKSLYSIHTKMLKKNLTTDGIHDIHGLRLIVENEADCYKARDVVHSLWSKVAERSKDYIINPKINGYQSLHTVVLSNDVVPLEVQIRTKEMHLQAEIGFAAHWRYKERAMKQPSFVLQMVEWARWVLTWQCEMMSKELCLSFWANDTVRPPCPFPCHSPDCPISYKPYGDHDGPVFVILLENEKMSVQEFPADSTLKDMIERVGPKSAMWNGCTFPLKEELRPKLNNEPAIDPDQKLKMGDVIKLTPSIPDKSLTEYREEIQRMYNQGLAVSGRRS